MSLGMHVPEIRLDPHVAETGPTKPKGMGILGINGATESTGNKAGRDTRARPHELDFEPYAADHGARDRPDGSARCLGGNCKIIHHLRDVGTAKANDNEQPDDMTEP